MTKREILPFRICVIQFCKHFHSPLFHRLAKMMSNIHVIGFDFKQLQPNISSSHLIVTISARVGKFALTQQPNHYSWTELFCCCCKDQKLLETLKCNAYQTEYKSRIVYYSSHQAYHNELKKYLKE